MKKKLIASILAATMVLTTAACGNENATNGSEASKNSEASESTVAAESSETVVEEEFSYPMTGKDKITWWTELNSNVSSANYANLGDTPGAKELSKQTGIEVEYIHPATGQLAEAFNLMLAEGEYPDIISYKIASEYKI